MIESLRCDEIRDLPSPTLVFDCGRIQANLRRMLEISGSPARLRPHFKTHKTREILQLELAVGITKHKCATLVEAETLAQGGAASVLLAYPLVGPNVGRFAELVRRHPQTQFIALADAEAHLLPLNDACGRAGVSAEVAIDLDVGQQRTGTGSQEAVELIALLERLPALRPGGLHLYDGHNVANAPEARQRLAELVHLAACELKDALNNAGLPCPRYVFGGTPGFLAHAAMDWPEAELSPGTCVLHDATYGRRYPELGFACAAQLLTRLVSRPSPTRLTFDAGAKALASDPPLEARALLCGLPPHRIVLQNEEHLVAETDQPSDLPLGAAVWAVPGHICPTVALHESAVVVENGRTVGRWKIAARDRRLSFEA